MQNNTPVDMSPEAITMRLKRVSQLRELCLVLGTAKPKETSLKPVEAVPMSPKDENKK